MTRLVLLFLLGGCNSPREKLLEVNHCHRVDAGNSWGPPENGGVIGPFVCEHPWPEMRAGCHLVDGGDLDCYRDLP